jgi:hypothetical protein
VNEVSLSESGVLLVAHTSPAYVAEAVAMAWSIRHNSPGISVSLVTDVLDPHLPAGLFDQVVAYDFSGKGGVSFKVWLDEMTPYPGTTLFLDSDAFVFRSLEPLFEKYAQHPFTALGRNVARARHWFQDPEFVKEKFGMSEVPFFIGDFYMFDRSEDSQRVFEIARTLFDQYDDLGIKRLYGGKNEEPLFALALHFCGIKVTGRKASEILALENVKDVSDLETNVLRGLAHCIVNGKKEEPIIIHYGTFRWLPDYFCERRRGERKVKGLKQESHCMSLLMSVLHSYKARVIRRLLKALKNCQRTSILHS